MHKKTQLLQQDNNRLEKQINQENKHIMDSMVSYLRGKNLSLHDQELVRQDLTAMVLSAQERGDSIQTVIGGDHQQFCDEVVASLPPRAPAQRLREGLSTLCLALSILLLLNIILSKGFFGLIQRLFSGAASALLIPVSLGAALSMGIIVLAAISLVNMVSRQAFRQDDVKSRLRLYPLAGATFAVVVVLQLVLRSPVLFSVHLLLLLALALALFLASLYLGREA